MNRPLLLRLFTSLAMLVTASLTAFAQAQTAQIPASFHGTYSLTFQTDHPEAPLPDGAPAELVLAPGGALCIADYVLTDPQLETGNSVEAFWTAGDAGVQLVVSDITGDFNEVNVLTLDGTFLGQMTGSKTSDSTACGSLGEIPASINDIADVFSLAEQAFPDLFPTVTSEASLRVLDGFLYRHYTASGVYIGISDGEVFLMGGPFGDQPQSVGSIVSTLTELYNELGLEPPGGDGNPGDDPDIDVPEGDFTLTVSGSVSGSVMGVPFNEQFNPLLVVDSIPAPDAGDLDSGAIEDRLVTQWDEAIAELDSAGISNISINDIEVGENRVFFNVKFDADTTMEGTSVVLSYDLDYEYLRN